MLADVKFGELITPSDAEIVFGHLEHHRERLLLPEDVDSHYEQEMASAIGRPVPSPHTGNGSIATEDCDELDVRSSCTCGSFGLSSTRATPQQTFPDVLPLCSTCGVFAPVASCLFIRPNVVPFLFGDSLCPCVYLSGCGGRGIVTSCCFVTCRVSDGPHES